MSAEYKDNLERINGIFSIIYNVEACIKLIGLRSRYFLEVWNWLDLFIVVASDVGFMLEAMFSNMERLVSLIVLIRALRIMRVLRLVRVSRGMRVLIGAV
jgi:voltage-gated cation channel